MRVVLDTNVFVSGVFFSGPPARILEAWRDGRVVLVVSAEILIEYRRVGQKLAEKERLLDLELWLALLVAEAEVVRAPALSESVCRDADDDKFIACAIAGECKIIVSGDSLLRQVSGYRGIQVVTPRSFVDDYLAGRT